MYLCNTGRGELCACCNCVGHSSITGKYRRCILYIDICGGVRVQYCRCMIAGATISQEGSVWGSQYEAGEEE